MESNRKILITFLATAAMLLPEKAGAIDMSPPPDTGSIEALIDAHKKLKKAEDVAVLELMSVTETTTLTSRITKKYNETRTTLNQRMADGQAYLKLALQLTNITLKLKQLVESYSEFTTLTYEHALKKPYVMVYYARANYKLEKEIKHLSTMIGGYTASGFNLLKATMEERYQLLDKIDSSIRKMNQIIWRNELICRSTLIFGLKSYHVKDLWGDETQELIKDVLIARWYKDQNVKI